MSESPEHKVLWDRFNAASAKIRRCMAMKNGGIGAENEYAAAYESLVKAGLQRALRPKYTA